MKSAVKNVWLNRAEGPCKECYAVVFHTGEEVPESDDSHYKDAKAERVDKDKIAGKVNSKLMVWGISVAKDGYDKVDFTVEWENGEVYNGRFDMGYGGRDSGESFWVSLQTRIEFIACTKRPYHFNDDIWAQHCERAEKEGWKKTGESMLAECAI